MGSAAPGPSPASAPSGDAGASDMNAQIGKVREASQPFTEFLSSIPALAPFQTQFSKLVRDVLVQVASAAKQQTGSSAQLPGS